MKTRRNFLKLAGAAVVSVTGVASASENPFGITKMESGYTQVAMEGKCGGDKKMEGSCGGNKPEIKKPEGACGGMNKQPMEGKCGGDKKMEGSCGAKPAPKMQEGKCGEGKCGSKS